MRNKIIEFSSKSGLIEIISFKKDKTKRSEVNIERFLKSVFLFFTLYLIMTSCDKDPTKSQVLVKVVNNGSAVEQAIVYVKEGAKPDPNLPLSQYERSFGADAFGEANLTLPFNDYYVLARGYSPSLKKYLRGSMSLHLNKKGQFNSQKVTLNIN